MTDTHYYQTAEGIIFNTPMVKLRRLVSENDANLFAKIESRNPGGSVKDRIAVGMIDAAEKDGSLKPGGTIVEPTSGNTGIGLAMVGTVRGYKVVLTMPESMSVERRALLKSLGAELVLTPAAMGMKGAIEKATELASEHGYFMPQQFNNPANPEIHRKTTGPEILTALEGMQIDACVFGVGTGGTLTGAGAVIKEAFPNAKICAVEPVKSPVLSGGAPGPHKIQGIGAGFVPAILNTELIDEVIQVDDLDAFNTAKRASKEEGLMIGISSGAACWAAMKVAKDLGKGKNVVTLFPDLWERYLSMEQLFSQ